MSGGNASTSLVTRYGSAVLNGNCFTWNIDKPYNGAEYFSDFFQFCGHCCYLSAAFISCGDSSITLHVTSALCKNISCRYSVNLKMKYDYEFKFYAIAGEMQTIEESTKIKIFQGPLVTINERACLLNFSWMENGYYKIHEQGVQTEPECSNAVENESNTKVVKPLLAKDVCTYAECSNNVENETHTKGVEPLSAKDVCSHEEKKSNKFLEILSKDLISFYEDKKDPDCVLRVGETKFPVHRSMLSARSSVFAAMFHHDTSESRSGDVDILDVDAGALGDVLYYIYGGKVRGLSPETAVSMYVVSDKYALIDLREECLNFLTNNLTMENVCDAALLAHTHAETDLENNVLHFIEARLEELMQNDNWKKFSDSHFKLANYLLSSAFMATKNKMKKTSSNA